ncbi:MAG: twin-arginine translocation signal domain-containing protein, partial [Pirellula sp.]
MNHESTPAVSSASRRDFIKTGTSLAAAAGL